MSNPTPAAPPGARATVRLALASLHVAFMFIFVGGAILETFVYYPNWFQDMPASLETASTFMRARNPGMFFQVVAPLTVLSGIALVVLDWRQNAARNRVLAAVLLLIAIEAVTFQLVYPKITILIREGAAQHSVEFLRTTADGLMRIHLGRMIAIGIAAVASFTGFVRLVQVQARR